MKKLLSILTLTVAFIGLSAQSLPSEATHFISTYFPENTILEVHKEFSTNITYRVQLDLNTMIGFDNEGSWLLIVTSEQTMPHTLIPTKIQNYITSHEYALSDIISYDRARKNEVFVTMNDDAILVFDQSGNYLRTTHN